MNQLHLFRFQEPTPPRSFRWELPDCITCSVVPEKRGNNVYWYMRKSRMGQTANVYLGPVGSLTNSLLDKVAALIDSKLPAKVELEEMASSANA